MERFTAFDNAVGGPIPDVFMELSNLVLFDVEKNSLSGPAFVDLSGASSLESYRVSSNLLTGTIPEFSSSCALKEVWAASCEIVGSIPASIGACTDLGTNEQSFFVVEVPLNVAYYSSRTVLTFAFSLDLGVPLRRIVVSLQQQVDWDIT